MPIKTDKTSIWDYYKKRLEHRTRLGFDSKWPEVVRFKEGNQWPAPTPATRTLPRPVINQIDFIIKNKLSNIISPTLKMIFSPDEMPVNLMDESMKSQVERMKQAAEDYTDAAETTYHDICQDTLNEECVDDVLTLGTGITHYFFNDSFKGGQFLPYKGKIDADIIDPMDIFFDNPQGKFYKIDTEQRFIIIRKPMDTDTARELAKARKGEHLLIQPDNKGSSDSKYDNARQDIQDSNITTTLVMYYKENGEMYWTQISETAEIVPPTRLSPGEKGFEIYPLDILVFDTRKRCIYGRSVAEDLIPIQKYLNWGLGMMMKGIEQTAWPKIIAKVGALAEQVITNTPGEIIVDHSQPGIDGIKYMQPPNFSNEPIMLAEKLIEMVRQVTGTTEVSSGEVVGANMAAAAILALQAQAQKPNIFNQNKFFRSQEHKGRIYEEFYKCYYNLPRPIKAKDKMGKEITKRFVGSDSADISFALKIDVGPGSVFSESLQMTMLQNMYDKKDITKYQYVKYAPRNSVPQELKSDFEKEEEQIRLQQEQMNAMKQAAMQGLTPAEHQELNTNPQLMDNAIASVGGMPNGMQQMPQSPQGN